MPWLANAIRPNVAITDVRPTSSGISAATSDPSTIIRMMMVSVIEIRPTLPSPPWISASSALSVDSPTDSMVTPACRVSTFSTAATSVSMYVLASSYVPAGVYWIMTAWPSFEIWPVCGPSSGGARRSCTFGYCPSVRWTSATAARKAGSATVRVLDWTSTISLCAAVLSPFASIVNPALLMMRSAVRDSPTFASFWLICLTPTWLPTYIAPTTNTSQPISAVFQWVALQWPTRAARWLA